jgi:hypothetical protein
VLLDTRGQIFELKQSSGMVARLSCTRGFRRDTRHMSGHAWNRNGGDWRRWMKLKMQITKQPRKTGELQAAHPGLLAI